MKTVADGSGAAKATDHDRSSPRPQVILCIVAVSSSAEVVQ
jgi:hypothetical protein